MNTKLFKSLIGISYCCILTLFAVSSLLILMPWFISLPIVYCLRDLFDINLAIKFRRYYINFVSRAYFSTAATAIEIIGGVKVCIHTESPEILSDSEKDR